MYKLFFRKCKFLSFVFSILLLPIIAGCQNNEEEKKVTPIEIKVKGPTPMPRENPSYNNISVNKNMRVPLYDSSAEEFRVAVQAKKNIEIGLQFHAVSDFDALFIECPSYVNDIGAIKFAIFKWDLSYARTVKGKPLHSMEVVDFIDNSWLRFSFNTRLSEDEYLLVIEGIWEEVGVLGYTKPFPGVRLYQGGIETIGCLKVDIGYIHSADENHPINIMNVKPDTWTAIDGLGRTLQEYKDIGDKRDKYVGMFYWTWFDTKPRSITPRNLNKIIKEYPEAINDYDHPVWYEKPNPDFYWDESIYGYYLSSDKYVYRKHAELLADAGVDVVFFDATNVEYIWIDQYEALCEAWLEARENGINTPKISFLTNFHKSAENYKCNINQLEKLYKLLYRPGKYQDLWFYWEGKPLLMSRHEDLDLENALQKEIRNFFTFRPGNPYYFTEEPEVQDNWGWLSIYPQTKYGIDKSGNIEQICVGVSQNANEKGLTAMNDKGTYGRSYTKGEFSYTYKYNGQTIVVDKNIENASKYGLNFQQQWDYAHKNDPKFVWVTGWNERRVDRQKQWQGVENAFPDQFNDEYSRDIEPTTGDLKDHYYYQLVSNIRKFKGVQKPDEVDAKKTISLSKGLNQWDNVLPEFNHYSGNTPRRDIYSISKDIKYENHTMRNDIIQSKVAYDNEYVYFMVKCVDNITPHTDSAWMRLFIDTEESDKNWESFEYVINRLNPTEKKCIIERSTGGWEWEKVGEAAYSVTGNVMQIKVPRSLLNKEGSETPEFNFKWADNTQVDGDIMDFYLNGDVAPGGRFKFAFRENAPIHKKV